MYEKIDSSNFAHFEWLYNRYINEPIGINGHKLVCRMASHMLAELEEKDNASLSDPLECAIASCELPKDEKFIDLREFYSQFKMCESSISKNLRSDKKFSDFCGMKVNNRYLIQPRRAIYYLSRFGSGKMKAKIKKEIIKSQENEEKCPSN